MTERSRREVLGLVVAGMVGFVGGFQSKVVEAAPQPGGPCPRKGRIRKVGSRTLVCRERGGALVWVNRKGGTEASASQTGTGGTFVPAITTNDLVIGVPRIVVVTDSTGLKKYVGIVRSAAGVVAFEPRCTHQGYQLEVAGNDWYCDYHGSRFVGESGAVITGPARTALRRYSAEDRAGTVFVRI